MEQNRKDSPKNNNNKPNDKKPRISLFTMLLIAMAVGMIRLGITASQAQKAQAYVTQLEAENEQLRDAYLAGYDAEEARRQAEAMGMIPIEDAEHVIIDVQIPQPEPEPTFWENIGLFFSELFA